MEICDPLNPSKAHREDVWYPRNGHTKREVLLLPCHSTNVPPRKPPNELNLLNSPHNPIRRNNKSQKSPPSKTKILQSYQSVASLPCVSDRSFRLPAPGDVVVDLIRLVFPLDLSFSDEPSHTSMILSLCHKDCNMGW
jgi:hypothetical protein